MSCEAMNMSGSNRYSTQGERCSNRGQHTIPYYVNGEKYVTLVCRQHQKFYYKAIQAEGFTLHDGTYIILKDANEN